MQPTIRATVLFAMLSLAAGGLGGQAPAPPNLARDGVFGFPQAQAKVVCDAKELRVSVWNDGGHLYVQAILWGDGDDAPGETGDGRAIGDWSSLSLDVDANQEDTPQVDRVYSLNPWPTLTGLRYQVILGRGASTGLLGDSQGRGAIRYVDAVDKKRVRVDSFVIPLAEIKKKPGDAIRLAYWGSSPQPRLTVNSVGFRSDGSYYSHVLPKDRFHAITLADRPAALDLKQVPNGQDDAVALPQRALKPVPKIGAEPPEVVAKDWINVETPPTLAKLKGKVVLVEFWATWCGPCVAGIPHLNEWHAKYGPRGLHILSFTDQSRQGIEKFLQATPMKHPLGVGSDLAAEYGVQGIPHAFLIGRDGKLLWHGNPFFGGDLEKRLRAALDAK